MWYNAYKGSRLTKGTEYNVYYIGDFHMRRSTFLVAKEKARWCTVTCHDNGRQ